MSVVIEPGRVFYDNSGRLLSSGLAVAYFYGAGNGFVLEPTYPTAADQLALSNANSNPMVIQSDGRLALQVHCANPVRMITKTTVGGATIEDEDHLIPQSPLTDLEQARTAAEITAGVTPTRLISTSGRLLYEGDAERYGTTGLGVSNDTAALNRWLAVAAVLGWGRLPSGVYLASALTLTLTGTRITQSVRIFGDSRVMTRIQQVASTASALLTVTSASPSAAIVAVPFVIEDMGLFGSSKFAGSKGIAMNSMAIFEANRVLVTGFDTGIPLTSALLGVFRGCEVTDNNNGYVTRLGAVATYNNHIQIIGGRVNNNSTWGMDFGAGNQITVSEVDMEANGTAATAATVTITQASPAVVSWTGHGRSAGDVVVFSTAGTLLLPMVARKNYYVISAGLTANAFQFALTPGGAAINTTTAGSGVHTGIYSNTGVCIIRNTMDDEIGLSNVNWHRNWLESNLGRGLYVEAGMAEFALDMDGGHIIAQDHGLALFVAQARRLNIRGVESPTAGDTWDYDHVDQVTVDNSLVDTAVHLNVTYPTYSGLQANGVTHHTGRSDAFTTTLTGCTTSPTASVVVYQQGNEVTLEFPDLLAVSNTTACTLTGLPTQYTPASDKGVVLITEDNTTANTPNMCTIGSNGVITLRAGATGAFTNSNNKGIKASSCRYRVA